ncbi:MAG: LysR family transcriptional regulator [Rhizobiales bacterium]|nr:LysR family transcriptional regulator [Hyphomicrobiales bacterium]
MSLTAALRDLNKLNAFVRVAERRSFTKAAADLRTTPSVVSKHMKELEDALGFSLLNRSTHGIVLTDAGEGLFQNCLQMLAKLDDYVVGTRNLQTGPYGTLRVQAASDYARCVLTPLILEFAKRHPSLRVHLSVVTGDSNSVEDGFDVIIAGKKPSLPGLVDQDLGEVQHVVCASPAYFLRFGRPKEPQDLREHNCLANLYSGPKDWSFQTASRQLLVGVKGALSSNSSAVLIQMALQGYGIIRVPRYAVKAELADKTLKAIFERVTLSPERMYAYFSKAKHLPAKTSDFVHFLQASIAAR